MKKPSQSRRVRRVCCVYCPGRTMIVESQYVQHLRTEHAPYGVWLTTKRIVLARCLPA